MAFIKKNNTELESSTAPEEPRNLEDLMVSLEDETPSVRRQAARDLVEFPAASPALVSRLKRETNLSVRGAIFGTLTRLGDDAAVAGLVDCLRSEESALRNEAIEAMKQLPAEVATIMQELLSDPDPDVRIFTLNILESLRHPDVEKWLIQVIESDEHVNVCGAALDVLCEVGSEAAQEALVRVKERFLGEAYVQFAASLALKRIRNQ